MKVQFGAHLRDTLKAWMSATDEDRGLCRSITHAELRSSHRRWHGDDEKGRFTHHGIVRLNESPLDIELHWRQSADSATKLIGYYRLDLDGLLARGYIRADSEPGKVRLRFVHEKDCIYVQHLATKHLLVGRFV